MQSYLTSDILKPLGQALSITGLVLCMPFCFAFRHYLRFLDHLQFFYVFAFVLASNSIMFSNYLSNSWVAFDKNIFFFCTTGELVCTAGFPLSFGACLLVFLLIMRLIVAIQTCRKKEIRFEPVYTFFKGLTRWIYAPLSYWSVYFLIKSIQGVTDSLISSIVILAICALFPVAQLVGYKMIQTQKDNIWRKWLQFANFYRLFLICGLMAIGSVLGTMIPYYIVYGVYVTYAILFAIKNNFHYKVVGRIIFVTGEAFMIAAFSFFLFKKEFLTSYMLDFILVAVLFLMDLIYYIVQLVSYYQNGVPGQTDSQKVTPDATDDRILNNNSSSPKKGKKNSYDIDLNDVDNEFNGSKEDIYAREELSPQLKGNKSKANLPGRRK